MILRTRRRSGYGKVRKSVGSSGILTVESVASPPNRMTGRRIRLRRIRRSVGIRLSTCRRTWKGNRERTPENRGRTIGTLRNRARRGSVRGMEGEESGNRRKPRGGRQHRLARTYRKGRAGLREIRMRMSGRRREGRRKMSDESVSGNRKSGRSGNGIRSEPNHRTFR